MDKRFRVEAIPPINRGAQIFKQDVRVFIQAQNAEWTGPVSVATPPKISEVVDWENDPIGILPFLAQPIREQLAQIIETLDRLAQKLPRKKRKATLNATIQFSADDINFKATHKAVVENLRGNIDREYQRRAEF
jgi:hypothetical protein